MEEIKKTEAVETKKVVNTKKTDSKSVRPRSNDAKGRNQGGRRPRRGGFNKPKSLYEEKVINISRVTKVVKGGRRFSFSVTTVIGNRNGKVGFGHGKANEIPDAIKKSIKIAEKNMINVPIVNGTIPHEARGKFLSSNIMLKPAPKGKGIIASSAVRVVVELAGYKDIYTKSYGSRSKQNVVQATIKVLKSLRTIEQVAKLRGISEKAILGRS